MQSSASDSEMLKLYHAVKTEAMKAKQSVDPTQCTLLEKAVGKCCRGEARAQAKHGSARGEAEERLMKPRSNKILYIVIAIICALFYWRNRK